MYVERCNLSTHAYPGEHSVMYTTAKSLYYIPETNIFHTNCIWIFKKKTMFHEDDIWIDHGFLHISQLSACWLEFNIFTFREITDKDFFWCCFLYIMVMVPHLLHYGLILCRDFAMFTLIAFSLPFVCGYVYNVFILDIFIVVMKITITW